MKKMYNDYCTSYEKLSAHRNKIVKEYRHTKDNEKIKYRKMLYNALMDIKDTIMEIEKYLDWKDRYFLHKNIDEIRRLTFKKNSNYGFILEEKKIVALRDIIQSRDRKDSVKNILKENLTKQQYFCIMLFYGFKKKQGQIAEELGISQQAVNEHIKKAVEKIKILDIF
jgi:RNA polymerase sigma factor (sigma-70 family)